VFDRASKAMNDLRIIPRLVVVMLSVQAYNVGEWYMALAAPTMEQSAFVTTFYTLALPAAFKFYMSKGL